MTPVDLKNILYSLVEPQYQTFDVRFGSSTRKRRLGTYLRKTRLITIYPKNSENRFELIGAGLHELAHHLTWERDGHVYALSATDRKHVQHHGKEFFRQLKALVAKFNFRYGERVKGFMFCGSGSPSRSPGFMKFSEFDRRINPVRFGFVVADGVPNYAGNDKSSRRSKRRRKVVLIGLSSKRNEALMYCSVTRKFDQRVSKSLMKLLCSYAAAKPKPGELWEFGVVAKRVLKAPRK